MKPEDQAAFNDALVNRCQTVVTVPQDFEAGWQAALEYARQPAEPVYQTDGGDGDWIDCATKEIMEANKANGFKTRVLYTTPQPAPVMRLTDDEIEAAITEAVKNEKCPWIGYKQDAEGEYTLPFLSRTHYGIAYAIMDAMQAKAQPASSKNEQSVFEDWLSRVRPSGDVDQVQRQWESSSEFKDWQSEQSQPAQDVRELVDVLKRTLETIDRQLELIADRAAGDFLNKRPIVQSLQAHATRIRAALTHRDAQPAVAVNQRMRTALQEIANTVNYAQWYQETAEKALEDANPSDGTLDKVSAAVAVNEYNDYKRWYEEAMVVSNEAGYVGIDAAQTIRELAKKSKAVAVNEQMLEALRLIRGKHGCGALTLPQADLQRVDAAIAEAEKAKGGV